MRTILWSIALTVVIGCSHGEYRLSPQVTEAARRDTPIEIDLSSPKKALLDQLKIIRALVDKKELNEQDLTEIERLHALYQAVRALASASELLVPPYSRLKIALPSYCLDPLRSIPTHHEPFLWKRESPGIPYYAKIIKLVTRNQSLAQEDVQELIWNLRNKSNYEDYPPRLKKMIEQIDPGAKVVLPSRVKGALQVSAGELIRDAIPELGVAGDALSLIEGHYYSYSEISERLRSRTQSKSESNQGSELSNVESKPGVYATVRSSGFSKQDVVFFNTNGSAAIIDLSEYFLKPISSNVQRIGLSVDVFVGRSVLSTIDTVLKDAIIRNSAYWYAGQLSADELAFIKEHPVEALNAYAQSRRAILSTWKHFGRNSESDESDAFRHFVWAGLLAQQLGHKLAGEFLSAHERFPSNAKEAERLSSEMDQQNNSEGLSSAKVLLDHGEFSSGRLEKEAYDALTQGRLIVVKPKGIGLIYPVN